MRAKRVVTGVLGSLFLILIIEYCPDYIFAGFITLASLIALYEYNKISFNKSVFKPLTAIHYFLAPALIYGAYMKNTALILIIIAFNPFISAFISLFKYDKNNKLDNAIIKQVFGLIYIPLSLSFAVLIKNSDNGTAWIYLLLAVVFASDTGAFYAGSYLGRNKLAPKVSPNKTVEGSAAGIFAAVCAGFLIKYLFLPDISCSKCFLFSIIVCIVGQVGDLFESMLKRSVGIKDSGNILPGHGGILDRIDALLFAAPAAYFIRVF